MASIRASMRCWPSAARVPCWAASWRAKSRSRRSSFRSSPGTLSALGGLIADLKSDFLKTVYTDLTPANLETVRQEFAALRERADEWLQQEQGHIDDAEYVYSAEMRYRGQSYEIDTVLGPAQVQTGDVHAVGQAFHDMHRRLYGHADERAPVQIVSLRVVISGNNDKPGFPRHAPRAGSPTPERAVRVAGRRFPRRGPVQPRQPERRPALHTARPSSHRTIAPPSSPATMYAGSTNTPICASLPKEPRRDRGQFPPAGARQSLHRRRRGDGLYAHAHRLLHLRQGNGGLLRPVDDAVAGKTFASPKTFGATWYTGLDYGRVIEMFDDYREGDIYLTNDPTAAMSPPTRLTCTCGSPCSGDGEAGLLRGQPYP